MLNYTLLNLVLGPLNLDFSNLWKADYINRWDLHLTDFWVPALVGIFCLVAFFQLLSKKKIGQAIIIFLVFLACFGMICTGSESALVNAAVGIADH